MSTVSGLGTHYQPRRTSDKLLQLLAVGKPLHILLTRTKLRRLLQEDPGVEGPLWFGRNPDDPLHALANILRLFSAIVLAPIYVFIPHTERSFTKLVQHFLWSVEWSQIPDAVLSQAPNQPSTNAALSRGQYAVSGYKPQWLLEVRFRGGEISSQRQVRYEAAKENNPSSSSDILALSPQARALQKSIQQHGYTAISYAMKSAEVLFEETGKKLDPQPEIKTGSKRKYSPRNRRSIVQTLLNEYARARVAAGKPDGYEFVWLDEFCLSDDGIKDEVETQHCRDMEIGQLADIFRGANSVVVFCHIVGCDHTAVNCPWGNRLFTLGEILHAPQVLRMTREANDDAANKLTTSITQIPGHVFRADMQTRAAEARMWHLYNIMQHTTNSGGVTWQSAIHSLVVEAVRRDEASHYQSHNFLGKALNGLLPRRSRLEDLQGGNGWADLAWLLELNQGYYNAAMLAAVCKLANDDVKEYRWWGKPIAPREGCERLEPLVTAFPVRFRHKGTGTTEPVLSIVGPKCVSISHMLRRDSAGLYHNEAMQPLASSVLIIWMASIILGLILFSVDFVVGLILMECATVVRVLIELAAGTLYVEKDSWMVFGGQHQHLELFRYLRSQDAAIDEIEEWGEQQLVPEWDTNGSTISEDQNASADNRSPIFLVDLRTGTLAKATVTSRPNDMVVLAVHGSGITCMLLDRDEEAKSASVACKVGMANFPPFVLAQAKMSGTIYVGDRLPPVPKRLRQLVTAIPPNDEPIDLEKGINSGLVRRHSAGGAGERIQTYPKPVPPPSAEQISSPSSHPPSRSSASSGGSGVRAVTNPSPPRTSQNEFDPYQEVRG